MRDDELLGYFSFSGAGGQAGFGQTGDVRLKIGNQPVLFPIAVAGRIEAAAAAGFLGLTGITFAFGATRRGFGQRAFGRRRQWALLARLALGFGRDFAARLASPLTWRSRGPPARRNFFGEKCAQEEASFRRARRRARSGGAAGRGRYRRGRARPAPGARRDARRLRCARRNRGACGDGRSRPWADAGDRCRGAASARHLAPSARVFSRGGAAGASAAGRDRAAHWRRANSVSRSARPCCGRSRGAAGARGFQRVALYRFDQRGAAADRARRRRTDRGAGCAGARYAAMADGALDQDLRRSDRACHRRRQWPRAGARSHGEIAMPKLGRQNSTAACCRPARCAPSCMAP